MTRMAVVAFAAAWLGTAGAATAQDFGFYMDSGYGGDFYSEPLPDIGSPGYATPDFDRPDFEPPDFEPYDTGEGYYEPAPGAGSQCHHQNHRRKRGHQQNYSYGYGEVPPIPYAEIPDPGTGGPYYGGEPYDQALVDPGYGGEVYQPKPRKKRRHAACVPGEVVQKRLTKQGWSGFRDPVKGDAIVQLTARRPDGLTYRLSLDRCTGVIISADLLTKRKRKRVSYKDTNDYAGGSPAY